MQAQSLAPYQLSFILGSLERLGHKPSQALLDDLLAPVTAPATLAAFPAADLVLLLVSVAKLRHVTGKSICACRVQLLC